MLREIHGIFRVILVLGFCPFTGKVPLNSPYQGHYSCDNTLYGRGVMFRLYEKEILILEKNCWKHFCDEALDIYMVEKRYSIEAETITYR